MQIEREREKKGKEKQVAKHVMRLWGIYCL